MSTPAHSAAAPDQVGRLQRVCLAVGGLGLAACVVGGLADPAQFFRSYLFGYLFWWSLGLGCLLILMVQHLTGGHWGLSIRRILEAGAGTFPLTLVLFLPLLLGLGELFVWAHPEEVAADPILQHKSAYLNVPFFLVRAGVYFAIWILLAHLLRKTSAAQDDNPSEQLARRLRMLSGPGLVVVAITITFASVDWAMSLDPHWFSTIYGVLFMVGPALAAMALAIIVVAVLGGEPPLSRFVDREATHDLGKLLLAFVMLWAYVNFSQLLIVWSGNLPEEIPFYIQRLHGGWQVLAIALVLFHFLLPFLLLLSRDLKRKPRLLGGVAVAVLAARLLDLYWLVAPSLQGHGATHAGLAVHWLDLVAPVGVGGIWLALFARQLGSRPLLPLGEPAVQQRLSAAAKPGEAA